MIIPYVRQGKLEWLTYYKIDDVSPQDIQAVYVHIHPDVEPSVLPSSAQLPDDARRLEVLLITGETRWFNL